MHLDRAVLYDFELAGSRVRLWKRLGESYEHVLMKALGYVMFAAEYAGLEIEPRVGLRYRPDLVARDGDGRFLFWGECGTTSLRKTVWLFKHSGARRLALFKMGGNVRPLIAEIQSAVDARYRPEGRASLINFRAETVARTLERKIERVEPDWYTETAL